MGGSGDGGGGGGGGGGSPECGGVSQTPSTGLRHPSFKEEGAGVWGVPVSLIGNHDDRERMREECQTDPFTFSSGPFVLVNSRRA